jgi:hypothetical protein
MLYRMKADHSVECEVFPERSAGDMDHDMTYITTESFERVWEPVPEPAPNRTEATLKNLYVLLEHGGLEENERAVIQAGINAINQAEKGPKLIEDELDAIVRNLGIVESGVVDDVCRRAAVELRKLRKENAENYDQAAYTFGMVAPQCTPSDTTSGVIDQLNNALAGRDNQIEQLRVQLAGCLTAAEGGTWPESTAEPGQYGYSLAYEKVLLLRRAYDKLSPQSPEETLAPPAVEIRKLRQELVFLQKRHDMLNDVQHHLKPRKFRVIVMGDLGTRQICEAEEIVES